VDGPRVVTVMVARSGRSLEGDEDDPPVCPLVCGSGENEVGLVRGVAVSERVSVTVRGMNGTVVEGLMGLGVNTVTMTVGDAVEAESVTVGMLVCADRLSCSVTV
jgi:hypothetical protein